MDREGEGTVVCEELSIIGSRLLTFDAKTLGTHTTVTLFHGVIFLYCILYTYNPQRIESFVVVVVVNYY